MKSQHRTTALLILISAVLYTSSTSANEKLRWKLKQGQKFDVVMNQNMTQKMNVGGQDVTIKNDMIMYMAWEVEKVDDAGNCQMTQTIKRMSMKVDGPAKFEFDSNDEKEPAGTAAFVYKAIKPIIGAKFQQTMNPRGEISDVVIPDDLEKSVKANPMLKQMFSKEALKDLVTKSAPVMPAEAVTKGHKWEKSAVTNSPAGKMGIDHTYSYAGKTEVDGKTLDKIDIDLKLEFKGGNPFNANVKVKKQDNKGHLLFDNKAGRLDSSKILQKMTLEITVGNQVIDQELETDIQLKLTPAK